ncbi:hypothetical protein [Shewanella glacialipiscicola]|uniref:hypothetical protein n=1 Tax=Shewanella glacialipiscicola TaxID=614069 RepID=UPI003D7A0249
MSSDNSAGVTALVFGGVQAVMVASILALSSFLFQANSRIAVLETKTEIQGLGIQTNTTYINKLNQAIADLNVTLMVLNERLKNEDSRGKS